MTVRAKVDIWNLALDRIGSTDVVESEDENRPEAAVCGRHYDKILRELLELMDWPFAIRQRGLTEISTQTASYSCDGSRTKFQVPASYLDTTQITVTHIVDATSVETELDAVDDYTITAEADGLPASITTVATYAAGITIQIDIALSRYGWDYLYALPADFVHAIGLLYEDIRYSMHPMSTRVRYSIMLNDAGDGYILAMDHSADDFDKLEYVCLMSHVPAMSSHFVDAVAWRLSVALALAIKKDPKLADYCMKNFDMSIRRAGAYEQNRNKFANIDEPITPSEAIRG